MSFLDNTWRTLWCLCWLSLAGVAIAADESDPSGLIQLGPGDSVKVEVYGHPDMTTTVYVGGDGNISVPLAGSVAVSGMSPVDAGRAVALALKNGGFLNDPHVTIALMQSRSARVAVLGEVHAPGRYTIDPKTSLFDLLAQAGGQGADAADYVYVLRPDGQGSVHRFTVRLNAVLDAGGSDTMTMEHLQGGDTLIVPRADQFYIYGEVTSPSKYRLDAGMTIVEAIARAGGITQRGSEHRIEIKRPTKDGRYQVFHAKLNDKIQADDVVYVKESIF